MSTPNKSLIAVLLGVLALRLDGADTATPVVSEPAPQAQVATGADAQFEIPATDAGLPGEGPIRRADWFRKLWFERRKGWSTQVQKDQGALVFLGDSITQGWGDVGSSFPGIKTANRGISGDTSRGVLIRLKDDVIALNPSGVVLLIGTNDLEEKAEPEVPAGNLKLIIEELRTYNPTMPVILCDVFPSSAVKSRPADKIRRINALYFDAMRDEPQVTILDTWSLFANAHGDAKDEEMPDLLHPNILGYAKWAAALRPVFETVGFAPAWPDDFLPEPGYTSIFDGHDLTGWEYEGGPTFTRKTGTPDGRYLVKNGRLVVTVAHTSKDYKILWTTVKYPKDFVLKLEFRASPNADSGIFVRSPQLQCRDFLIAGPFATLRALQAARLERNRGDRPRRARPLHLQRGCSRRCDAHTGKRCRWHRERPRAGRISAPADPGVALTAMAVAGHFAGRSLVRWGIIGCGDVTEVKSGPGFRNAAGSALVAVMRRDGALAESYARRHGVARWYNDAQALIADPEVDAIYVATPPDTHAHYALAAAAAGKPALVEKPMARHATECDAMIAAFGHASLPLFVSYYRRRMPYFLKVEELLKAGAIGRVTGVNYRLVEPHHKKGPLWRVDASLAGAGHFLDVGSHAALDLLDYLLGPLEDVTGRAANVASPYDVEDSVALSFRTADGAVGSMAWNFAGGASDDTMQLTGTEGELCFPMFSPKPLRLRTAAGEHEIENAYPKTVAQPLIQSVVDDLLGRGASPSTGVSARRTSVVMDRVLEAFYGGRGDAFWLRPLTWPGRRSA